MLGESIRNRDEERTAELKRSLLDVERRSDRATTNEDEQQPHSPLLRATDIPICKSKSFTSGLPLFPAGSEDGSPTGSLGFSPTEAQYLEKAIMQNTKRYDVQVNVMIVGNANTGKTCLMHTLLGSAFPTLAKPTTG